MGGIFVKKPAPPWRGLWVWTTKVDLLGNSSATTTFINTCLSAGVTDAYFFLLAADYVSSLSDIRTLTGLVNGVGIRCWGLEGYRGYFSDVSGPTALYSTVDAVGTFNSTVNANERFYGFSSDMEPQDGQGVGPNTFHNGIATSALNAVGGGVWQATEALDRSALMTDWVTIYAGCKSHALAAGLKYNGTVNDWVDDYFGEEITATYNGLNQNVMKHVMPMLDEYIVLTYNTNPANAANRAVAETAYANRQADRKVYTVIETHVGVGSGVSYGDTAGKQRRAMVEIDIARIKDILSPNVSFKGVGIHDWVGWRDLPI